MRLSLRPTAAAACLALIGVAAAAAGAEQSRQPGNRRSITVVACVAPQDAYVRASVPAAGATAPQLLLTNPRTGTPTHNLTGLREGDLVQHVGQRVEIAGTLEPSRTTPVLSTAEGTAVVGSVNSERAPAAGVTPDGAAAHEPADALSTTVRAGKVAEPTRASDPAYVVPSLPGLNVTSFRRVAGSCPAPASGQNVVAAATSDQRVETAAPIVPATTDGQQPIVARGCLVRQTPGGTARTPQAGSGDAFVLTQVAVERRESTTARGAVPGSVPGDAGSGTVPVVAGTAGAAPVDAGTQSFRLVMPSNDLGQLDAHVGDRIEVTGVLDANPTGQPSARGGESSPPAAPSAGRVQVAPIEVAHVSTPIRRITVSSFRPLGGACN